MPRNTEISATITSYMDPALRRRMLSVQKRRPRLTISKQVEKCVNAHLPELEKAAGLKPGVSV